MAELGRNYDVKKLINWCFEQSSTVRPDMGVIPNNWSGFDCHGLVGSINRQPWRKAGGGYAFAMNTYCMAWPLAPMVRYDKRFAREVGKWMLNAANAARLFYSDAYPPGRQSCPAWKGDPKHAIAYEGLRHWWHEDESFFAGGDPLKHNWPFKTDFGVYGSAFCGVFGGIVKTTNVKYVLQLDCLATETFSPDAYPTYLYFNPYDETKGVDIHLGPELVDLYDAIMGRFMVRSKSGKASISISANSASLIVVVPANGKLARHGNKTLINGVVVDFGNAEH